jgi:hypothetical protein
MPAGKAPKMHTSPLTHWLKVEKSGHVLKKHKNHAKMSQPGK